MPTTLYLLRHGRTQWNVEQRMQGHADPPLDEVGRAQAAALADRLQSESIDALYSSPLARALQTAQAVAARHDSLSIQTDVRLMERDLGELAGLTVEEAAARYPAFDRRFDNNYWRDPGPPGGEKQAQLEARAGACIDEILAAHPGQSVAVVSHGGALNAVLVHLLQIRSEKHTWFRLPNTALTKIIIGEKQIRLLQIGDDTHVMSV